jgi:hypothetical protein
LTFDFPTALQRLEEIRSKVPKYDEVSRDFLDEIKLIQKDFEYLSHHKRLLAIICSGPKKSEWEQRLMEASDYLNNLEAWPGMENYKKSIEDELVKVANNLEPITSEIHNILTSKGRPLEPIDIFEALYINQQATPLHGNYKEVWEKAPTEIKQYCEQMANALQESKIEKPKREKGMGQKVELQGEQLPPAQRLQTGKQAPIGEQLPGQQFPTGEQLPTQQFQTGERLPTQQFQGQQFPTGEQFPTPQEPELQIGKLAPIAELPPAQDVQTGKQAPSGEEPSTGQQIPTVFSIEREFILERGQAPESGYY